MSLPAFLTAQEWWHCSTALLLPLPQAVSWVWWFVLLLSSLLWSCCLWEGFITNWNPSWNEIPPLYGIIDPMILLWTSENPRRPWKVRDFTFGHCKCNSVCNLQPIFFIIQECMRNDVWLQRNKNRDLIILYIFIWNYSPWIKILGWSV